MDQQLIPLDGLVSEQPIVAKAPHALCHQCPLAKEVLVPTEYNPEAKYWVIGESPGWHEQDEGVAFVGESGHLLWRKLKQCAHIVREECNITNAVLCYPGRGADKEEVIEAARQCCAPRLAYETSASSLPKLALGKYARESMLGTPHEGESSTTLNGRWVDKTLSTLHPAALLRNPNEGKTFMDDLKKFGEGPKPLLPPPTYSVILGVDDLIKADLLNAGEIAFDLETNQVSILWDNILLMTITDSRRPNHAYIVPGEHPGWIQAGGENVMMSTMDDPFWEKFWSRDRPCKFVGHNAKFDIRFLRWQLKWDAHVDFDTMLAHYALDERQGTKDLKGISARWLDEPDWEVSLKQFLSSRNGDYGVVPWDVMCNYAAHDSTRTLMLRPLLERRLHKVDLYDWPFMRVLMPMNWMFCDSEMWGVHVDQEYLETLQQELRAEEVKLLGEFIEMSEGAVDNLNSTKQLSHYFYDILHLPLQTGKKVNPRSTDKLALEKLEITGGGHPAIKKLRAARRVSKMLGSYVENVWELLDQDGNCHPDNGFGTEIARVVVRDPALQTIPRADDREEGQYGVKVKTVYRARKGYKLGDVDLKQAEMRVAAALSGDPFLIDAYNNDRDIHVEICTRMYGPNFTKNQKTLEKMFLFSQLYGGNEYSFAGTAGIPIELAKEIARELAEVLPRLNAYKDEIAEEMRVKGYVQTRTGRRRRFPYINEVNKDEARKSALHSVVASGAADITNISAFRAHPKMLELDAHVLILIHDAIIFEYPDDYEVERQVIPYVYNTMMQVGQTFFPEVKWKGTAEVGYDWGHLEEVNIGDYETRLLRGPEVV